MKSVSYTHLDVYKRQALNEIKVRRDEKVYIYALKKEFYNNATGLSTEDVYKRQIIVCFDFDYAEPLAVCCVCEGFRIVFSDAAIYNDICITFPC